jgi:hypothetical protein
MAGVGGRDFSEPYFGVRLDQIRRLNLHETRLVRKDDSAGKFSKGLKSFC